MYTRYWFTATAYRKAVRQKLQTASGKGAKRYGTCVCILYIYIYIVLMCIYMYMYIHILIINIIRRTMN